MKAIHSWISIANYDSGKYSQIIYFRGLLVAFAFVWSLWLVVTVVYAEVVLGIFLSFLNPLSFHKPLLLPLFSIYLRYFDSPSLPLPSLSLPPFFSGTSSDSICDGRVPISYSSQQSKAGNLTIIYQSIIIAVTFLLACVFGYYSIVLFYSTKQVAVANQFVLGVGVILNVAFLVRCILYLILLSASIVSSVYLFITLLVTEVFPITFLLIQFNLRKLKEIVTPSVHVTTAVSDESHSPIFYSTVVSSPPEPSR
jgi:hypothetical protein